MTVKQTEIRKPSNRTPYKPTDSIEFEFSFAAIKRGVSAIIDTFHTGRSLRNDIRSLVRDPAIKSQLSQLNTLNEPFVCSDTACLGIFNSHYHGTTRTALGRVVISGGDFKVEQWSETQFLGLGRLSKGPKTTTALQTKVMAELAKEGVTADEVRKYILPKQPEEKLES